MPNVKIHLPTVFEFPLIRIVSSVRLMILLASLGGIAQAQPFVFPTKPLLPISDRERHEIVLRVIRDPKVKGILQEGQRPYRICTVNLVIPTPASLKEGTAKRRVKVVVYNPDKNRGAEALVDLSDIEPSIESREIQPDRIPLAADDIVEALELARPQAEPLLQGHPFQTETILVRPNDRTAACHDDRCVTVFFRTNDPLKAADILVNLTLKTAELKPPVGR